MNEKSLNPDMSKAVKINSAYLKRLGSKEKSVEGKERIAKLIGLYENRKFPRCRRSRK